MASEYQIAIKIAGNLDKSFNAAIQGAQSGLTALNALGKIGGASLKPDFGQIVNYNK